jgi:hypothetical protein
MSKDRKIDDADLANISGAGGEAELSQTDDSTSNDGVLTHKPAGGGGGGGAAGGVDEQDQDGGNQNLGG